MTPTDSLRRFFDWLETEKPDTRKAHAMLRKNVLGIVRDAVTAAERDIERRLGPEDDGRCWGFRECLRDLSFAHLRLLEERDRMHAQVPEGERGSDTWQSEPRVIGPELRGPRPDDPAVQERIAVLVRHPYFHPDAARKRHADAVEAAKWAVGIDWAVDATWCEFCHSRGGVHVPGCNGQPPTGNWQVTSPPPGAERKADGEERSEKVVPSLHAHCCKPGHPNCNGLHREFNDCDGCSFPDEHESRCLPVLREHVDPTIPEGHVRLLRFVGKDDLGYRQFEAQEPVRVEYRFAADCDPQWASLMKTDVLCLTDSGEIIEAEATNAGGGRE